ncbi:PepSY domain-containing protein [Massilibacterium senegalense]
MIRSIHLWLSLVVGAFICLLRISGSVLVFENEINRTLHSKMFAPSKGKH